MMRPCSELCMLSYAASNAAGSAPAHADFIAATASASDLPPSAHLVASALAGAGALTTSAAAASIAATWSHASFLRCSPLGWCHFSPSACWNFSSSAPTFT